MPEQSHLLSALAFSRMRTQPTILDSMIQNETQQGLDETIEAVMEAQADLQVALGWLRVHIRTLDSVPMDDLERDALDALGALEGVEERAAASLGKLHALLKDLGKEMA